jgi:hypothetical protein
MPGSNASPCAIPTTNPAFKKQVALFHAVSNCLPITTNQLSKTQAKAEKKWSEYR